MSSIGEGRGKSRVEFWRAKAPEPTSPDAANRMPGSSKLLILPPVVGIFLGPLRQGHAVWPWSAIVMVWAAVTGMAMAVLIVMIWQRTTATVQCLLPADDGDAS